MRIGVMPTASPTSFSPTSFSITSFSIRLTSGPLGGGELRARVSGSLHIADPGKMRANRRSVNGHHATAPDSSTFRREKVSFNVSFHAPAATARW
jgi:hypothetical protein